MRMKRQNIRATLLALVLSCGATVMVHAQEMAYSPGDRLLRAEESFALHSPAGVIEALAPVHRDMWKLDAVSEEALYLDAVARAGAGAASADLKLLRFIEEHPHSSRLPYAESRLGEWYYVRGEYGAALPWFRKVDVSLLPEEMAVATDYYYAFSLMKNGRDKEALDKFMPLVYAPDFGRDAKFYSGYLLMKTGDTGRSVPMLSELKDDAVYGSYARAYTASGLLSERRYSEALAVSEEALGGSSALPPEVRSSLLRSAGFAESHLGRKEKAAGYLEEYVRGTNAPGRVELLVLGKNLEELSRASSAIRYLEQVPSGENDFMSQLAYYYLGLAYLSQKDISSARAAFRQSAAIDRHEPLTKTAAFDAALAAYALTPGRVGEGSEALSAFISKYPRSEYLDQAVDHLEDAFLGEPDGKKALQALSRISPLPPALSRVREKVRLGQANRTLASGNTVAAARQYDDIISRNEDPASVAEAYLWKGEAAYREGDYRGALSSTLSYLQARPESLPLNPNAYFTLGYAAFNLRDYSASKGYLEKYLSVAPDASADSKTGVYNRLGDMAVQARDYDSAIRHFATAESFGGKEADYGMFSRGMALGLKKDYRGKVSVMSGLPNKYPSSEKAPEALFEEGQTLTLLGDQAGARSAFDRFFALYPSSPVAPKVGLQLALSYFNENRLDEAAGAYERVIRDYPKSDEAKTALQDLKSISIRLNRVDEYNRLSQAAGLGGTLSPEELDQMTYLAAERLITEGSPADARKALEDYIRNFPRGKYLQKAYYSKALLEYNGKNYRDAALTLEQLKGENLETDLSGKVYNLLGASYDKLGEPGRAAEAYLSKAGYMTTLEERSKAIRLAGERAEKSGSADFVYALAEDVSSGRYQVDASAKAEILGFAAARYAKTNQKARALKYAKEILALPNYGEHTMSRVIVALDLYDRGQYAEVQKRMNALTQKGSTDAYWLARGFILLSDTYAKLGDKMTARTYLESVRGSYPDSTDGIKEMIDERLQKL